MAPSAVVDALSPQGGVRWLEPTHDGGAVMDGAPGISGGVAAQAEPLALSLDDAIALGLKSNLQVLLANETDRAVRGQILSAIFELMPNLRATAYTSTQELNLAAMGFKPASLARFGPGAGKFSNIVKVDTTAAQISADQVLFNLPDLYLYAAAKKAQNVVALGVLNVRGGVVEAVGTQYLAALAEAAQIADAEALATADEEVLRQATLSHEAGVGTNVDVLRAQVQLKNEQQAVVRAQNDFAKAKIALNRLMGLPADQQITLTDTVPYAELDALPLDEARTIAYGRRKDLLGLEAQLEVAERARKAVKYERLPTLAVNGFYGVLGETRGLYHGVFTAQGVLKIPVFEEARFRGERDLVAAQEGALRRQIESLRVDIDAQIRASMLDVESARQLVKVAQSNVALAAEALSDTRDRYAAGVDDNLPVVRAQAALEDAQSRLIGVEFQYNRAKLDLARNSGVVESQYKQYLGR
jgi:outer membrane protein TolC